MKETKITLLNNFIKIQIVKLSSIFNKIDLSIDEQSL